MRLGMLGAVLWGLLCVGASPGLAESSRWESYRSEDHGFRMAIPNGADVIDKQGSEGWSALGAEAEGVEVWGWASLGTFVEPEELAKLAAFATGIEEQHWSLIDERQSVNGWDWCRTVQAETRDQKVFGVYGVGAKGSYMVLLLTTPEDFSARRDEYLEWHDAVEPD